MKQIYDNSLGEQVLIKITEKHCIIYIKDETNADAEICIPVEDAVNIANRIIEECDLEY